jgi:hypothetical protein
MVYAEDEHLAPFFLKKNGFRGVHPVGRIRRNALGFNSRIALPETLCPPGRGSLALGGKGCGMR